MSFQIYKPFEGDEHNMGLLLEEYNGTYHLVSAVKTNKTNSSVIKKWAYPQTKDREPSSRALPWQIKLGESKKGAADTLKYFLKELEANNAI